LSVYLKIELMHSVLGSPPLPVHPSPAVFKLLHRLTRSMGSVGAGVWTPKATDVLKLKLANQVWAGLQSVLEGLLFADELKEATAMETEEQPGPSPQEETSGENGDGPGAINRERLLQITFDAFYLDSAFRSRISSASEGESDALPTKLILSEELRRLMK